MRANKIKKDIDKIIYIFLFYTEYIFFISNPKNFSATFLNLSLLPLTKKSTLPFLSEVFRLSFNFSKEYSSKAVSLAGSTILPEKYFSISSLIIG